MSAVSIRTAAAVLKAAITLLGTNDLKERVGKDWVEKVNRAKNLIRRGKEIAEQINILGDDGVPISYHEQFWKGELIDFVILQQDAFDPIDSLCPMDRQEYMLSLVLKVCDIPFQFDDYEQCGAHYKEIINILRQMNYSPFKSEQFNTYLEQLNTLLSHEQ